MLKLQPLLSEYLIENGNLPLAGTGQLFIDQKPAAVQEVDSLINPPQNSTVFSKEIPSEADLEKLTSFIANRLSLSPQQAAKLLVEEGTLSAAFAENEVFDWHPFGNVQREENGDFFFQQDSNFSSYLPAISLQQHQPKPEVLPVAELIEPALVSELIYEPTEPVKKERWWIWAIVILVVSIVLILIRFLE